VPHQSLISVGSIRSHDSCALRAGFGRVVVRNDNLVSCLDLPFVKLKQLVEHVVVCCRTEVVFAACPVSMDGWLRRSPLTSERLFDGWSLADSSDSSALCFETVNADLPNLPRGFFNLIDQTVLLLVLHLTRLWGDIVDEIKLHPLVLGFVRVLSRVTDELVQKDVFALSRATEVRACLQGRALGHNICLYFLLL